VDFEDRITIPTPEGVQLELTLAGLGSRSVSGAVDLLLKLAIVAALVLVLALALPDELALAVIVPAVALVLLGYDVLFETRRGGRTPGKQCAGLRVVRSGGRPVDLTASAIRNVLRLVDGLPLAFVPTVVCVLATARNQRPGDLAADTVVVRERRAAGAPPDAGLRDRRHALPARAAHWDVSGVGSDDLATVRSFLERREGLTAEARERLAARLHAGLAPMVGGADEADHERFLEAVYAIKSGRG
jgi:uncharacterized RDD family membrane protein YckC